MKHFSGFILILSIVVLSFFQGESHFVKPWHLCKSKEISDPPLLCKPPECSNLCGTWYPGGLGICIAGVCECLHNCYKDIGVAQPPPSDTSPTTPDEISKMPFSPSEPINP